MNIGAVDIGSNAIRLLIGTVFRTEDKIKINKASFIRIPVRLGKDVFTKGEISTNKILKLEKTLLAFKCLMEVYDVSYSRICATSAMRDASNGKEIIKSLAKNFDINIEIIDGNEEANLIFKTINAQNFNLDKKYLFVDVGGGSTEITVVVKGQKIKSKSFNIGTIRKLKDNDLVDVWQSMKVWLKDVEDVDTFEMLGSGGNINKIIKMLGEKGVRETDYKSFKEFIDYLATFSVKERIEKFGLREDRADVIVFAGQIYLRILKFTKINDVMVPKIGLSDGIIYDLFEKYGYNS